MVEIDCDDALVAEARGVIHARLRPLLPMLDPDGRAEVRVRVSRSAGGERARVEIMCSTPKISADVSAASATAATLRAFDWLTAQLRAVTQEEVPSKLGRAGGSLSEPPRSLTG